MRHKKKTAPGPRKHRQTSSPEQPGLIAQGKNREQSATGKSTLYNRSHRTNVVRFSGEGGAYFPLLGEVVRRRAFVRCKRLLCCTAPPCSWRTCFAKRILSSDW